MLKRLAPLVPMSFVLLLAACASHSPEPQVAKEPTAAKSSIDVERDAIAWQDVEDEGADNSSAGTPALASSILERAFELIGTPYRFGGTTAKGFDCSGLINFVYRDMTGIHSASRRGGGVRVDSLDSSYWSLSYMEAKRVLEPGYKDALTSKR